MMKAMRSRKAEQGFTLIELMIVIAIIAILAAVAIPNFMQARDRARRTSCIQNLGTWRKVAEMYANDHDSSSYATELDDNVITTVNGKMVSDASSGELVNAMQRYTNVTSTAQGCYKSLFDVVVAGYSIYANANDRLRTPITATPDEILQP